MDWSRRKMQESLTFLNNCKNIITEGWRSRGASVEVPTGYVNQSEKIRRIQEITDKLRSANNLSSEVHLRKVTMNTEQFRTDRRQKLESISKECYDVLIEIFDEYLDQKETLMKEVTNNLGHYHEGTTDLYKQYKYSITQWRLAQVEMAFAHFVEDYLDSSVEAGVLENADTALAKRFKDYMEEILNWIENQKKEAENYEINSLEVTTYLAYFQNSFFTYFYRNGDATNCLITCYEFNKEATIALIVGGYMKLINGASTSLQCTASRGRFSAYNGQKIRQLQNSNNQNRVDVGNFIEQQFAQLIAISAHQIGRDINTLRNAPASDSQQFENAHESFWGSIQQIQASYEQLGNGLDLPEYSRVWKRLSAFNEVFSVNRPNTIGYFANTRQQLQQSSFVNVHSIC